MNQRTGVLSVLLLWAVGTIAIVIAGPESRWPVWILVSAATALPAVAMFNAAKKGSTADGRERLAWRILAVGMTLMIPVYLAEFLGAFVLEDVLISLAYLCGGIAIVMVPLPHAAPYQRLVASLDALGVGVVVAPATFWVSSGSEIDIAGHTVWAMSDAAIMAMIGYVALRRSQRRGLDWPLLGMMAGVGAYLTAILVSTLGDTAYFIGHPADHFYFTGMACFAAAPLARDRAEEPSRQILKPVRWGHVLFPYFLVGALAVTLLIHQIMSWGDDPIGTVIVLGILAAMIIVLIRQLAMIAEQRRKIVVEQNGVIATVSHELRTPLTTVVGFLDLLEDWGSFSDGEKIEMVGLMRNQSHVLARVVGDLVAVARQEMDHIEITKVPVAVDELLESALDVIPELDDATVRVHISDSIAMTADRERMLQILTNYLSNAAKYGAGLVNVVAFSDSAATVIEVHDNGPGVPDLFRLVVWERFERGPQRQGAIPGSGIGLSVARGIARSHGGETLYRRSERLGGACFSVRIPNEVAGLIQPGDRDAPLSA